MADVHRVRVIQSGGFAGLTRRYEVEAARLDPAQCRRLGELVAALQRSAARRTEAGRQPDRFQFDVEVVTAAGATRWRVAEAGASPEQKALIDWIKAAARPG
jgi:Ser/Thr protein kinase RdoA (MazF antagonist)